MNSVLPKRSFLRWGFGVGSGERRLNTLLQNLSSIIVHLGCDVVSVKDKAYDLDHLRPHQAIQ